MYEKLLKGLKRSYLIFIIAMVIIWLMMSMIGISSGTYFPMLIIFVFFLPFFIIFFTCYKNADKKAKLLQDKLDIQSNDEFNILLENSRRLAKYIFLSDNHLIEFNNFKAFELSGIDYLEKTVKSDEDNTTYGIDIFGRHGTYNMPFPNKSKRDEAYNAIYEAVGNGIGNKRLW